jgi:8-oxo-dGTP pyrophosphatase MutT (NUDIX family)
MNIVRSLQPFPQEVTSSIFLAGTTRNPKNARSWRLDALELLDMANYSGTVFVPEPEHEDEKLSHASVGYEAQVDWEEEALNRADCILFWIPRTERILDHLTTADDWGYWKNSGKCVLGVPSSVLHADYQRSWAARLAVPLYSSLDEMVAATLVKIADGAVRVGGEVQVPLQVWRHQAFQAWLHSQREAGNRLDGARLLWTFRVGAKRDQVFSWILQANIHVAAEGRNKTNEFVLGRTDVSAVVLYARPPTDAGLDPVFDAEVVLVREFRSTVRNQAGFVYELPGGSAHERKNDDDDADLSTAITEVGEETGLKIDPTRLRRQGGRQLSATLSVHAACLFSAELTPEEMARMRDDAASGMVHGVHADSERTYVDVATLRDVIEAGLADWTTIGQIATALGRPGGGI